MSRQPLFVISKADGILKSPSVYQVGYIHVATPWLHLYIATERWGELGLAAIKITRKEL